MRRASADSNDRQVCSAARERWRLMTGILMLVVLAMLIARAARPEQLAWLVAGKARRAASGGAGPKVPQPTGPTDEDPEQADAAGRSFRRSPTARELGPEEMVAYNRLVSWVKNQSFARLWQRAKKGCGIPICTTTPDKHRGELVALDIEIGRAAERRQESRRRAAVRGLGDHRGVAGPTVRSDRGRLPQGHARRL